MYALLMKSYQDKVSEDNIEDILDNIIKSHEDRIAELNYTQ